MIQKFLASCRLFMIISLLQILVKSRSLQFFFCKLVINARFAFNDHINEKIGKAMKGVGFFVNCNVFYHVRVYELLKNPS